MVCSTIQGCTTNINYYYINVVCILIVPHWGTNQECDINQGNTVCVKFLCIPVSYFDVRWERVWYILLYTLIMATAEWLVSL